MVSHTAECSINFHTLLRALDETAAERLRAMGCPHCGGRLHVAAFPRKVRGLTDEAVEAGEYESRFSFCCGAEGCRRRATPPSVRFSLRRVYATVAVVALSLIGSARTSAVDAGDVMARPGAPARSTRRRWQRFWREGLLENAWLVAMLGQLRERPSFTSSPSSLLELFSGTLHEQMLHLIRWLSPLTTGSVPPEASRVVMAR